MKAAVEQVQQEYAFSQRRACALLQWRYRAAATRRGARMSRCEPDWWSWRERSRVSGTGDCRCCCIELGTRSIISECTGCIASRAQYSPEEA